MDKGGKVRLSQVLDNPDMVRKLVAKGADVNQKDAGGRTPLHILFSHEEPNLESAEIIRQNGGDINSQDLQGETPLYYAILWAESVTDVAWLLANGADPNLTRSLQHAVCEGQTAIVRMLLEAGADPNNPKSFSPLCYAMRLSYNLDEMVDLLLAYGADPVEADKDRGLTPLAYAVRHGFDPDMEAYGINTLRECAMCLEDPSHYLGVIRKVYDQARRRGTPYTAEQLNKALSEYRKQNYPRGLFELFLEWNPEANQKLVLENGGFTRPLIMACGDENVDIDAIRHLLRLGADPNLTDHKGSTPLHAAVQSGAPDTINFLLDSMDPKLINKANELGQTALHLACEKTHHPGYHIYRNRRYFLGSQADGMADMDVIRLLRVLTEDEQLALKHARCISVTENLLDKGASPYAQDYNGATPMHYACRIGMLELVDALSRVRFGRYILKDKQGQTPLHWAAKYGRVDIVQAMTYPPGIWSDKGVHPVKAPVIVFGELSRQILPNVGDEKGRLPIHLAAMVGQTDVIQALLQRATTKYQSEDIYGNTALWYAEDEEHDDCAAKLREAIAELEEDTKPKYGIPISRYVISLVVCVIQVVITLAVMFPRAVASQAWSFCVGAWRCVVVGWRGVVAGGRYVVAGWRHLRNMYCEGVSEIH